MKRNHSLNFAGAYYYYKTEDGKTYEQTMLDVVAYARELDIPYR